MDIDTYFKKHMPQISNILVESLREAVITKDIEKLSEESLLKKIFDSGIAKTPEEFFLLGAISKFMCERFPSAVITTQEQLNKAKQN